jgi:signal transduction histidine kinase
MAKRPGCLRGPRSAVRVSPYMSDNATRRGRRRTSPLGTLVAAIVLVCLFIVGLEGWHTWEARAITIAADKVETENLARSLAQHLHDLAQTTDLVLIGIREQLEVNGKSQDALERLHHWMVRATEVVPMIHGVFVYDALGDWMVNSVSMVRSPLNNRDREYFQYHRDHNEDVIHFGEPVQSRSDGSWIVTVSRRIDTADGAFAGVVLATISIDALRKFYSNFSIGKLGAITLLSGSGIVLAREPSNGVAVGRDLSRTQVFQEFLPRSPVGSFETVYAVDGITRVASYRRVEAYPLVIIVAHGLDTVLSEWRSGMGLHLTITFATLLTLTILGVRFARQLQKTQSVTRQLLASNTVLSETQDAVRNLLDNADQGFLTIGPDLLVGSQCSAACEEMLGGVPAGKPIIDLICRRTSPGIESGIRVPLESAFLDSSDFVRSLKLELLPTTFNLDEKIIEASYKFLASSNRLMLILTDVTHVAHLAETVECERLRLEMVVLAFTEGEAFAGLVNDYQQFLVHELPHLVRQINDPTIRDDLCRRVHTYKGLLAQFSFHYGPRSLHEFETRLSAKESWEIGSSDAIGSEALLFQFKRDLASVSDVLGTDATPSARRLFLSQEQLRAMERVAKETLASGEGHRASPELRQMLQRLAGLEMLDAKAALLLHGRGALALAAQLHKRLAPIVVQGDDAELPPEIYREFFRSLVHVFRNAVDHGIEYPDERVLAGKPPEGLIRCNFCDFGGSFEVTIEDDGAGVDRSVLEDKLITAGNGRQWIKDLSLEELVFREGLSSRSTATPISGRGIGLAAVKAELDKLGGFVTVETERNVGTRFRFRLPTKPHSRVFNDANAEAVAIT